jgi:hypothetical protein
MHLRIHALAAIVAISCAGVVHAAGSAQPDRATRAAVITDFKAARAAGKLHRTDWDDELAARPTAGSTQTRSGVKAQAQAAAVARAALPGPLQSRNYNPYGAEILKPDVATRAEVRSEVLTARAEHTLTPAGEAAVPMARAPRSTSLSAAF